MKGATVISVVFATILVFAGFLSTASIVVYPAPADACGMAADLICVGCQNVSRSKPRFCADIPCSDSCNGGTTKGFCRESGKCLGQTTSGLNGASQGLGMAKQILDILNGVKSLLGQGAGGAGGGMPPPYQQGTCPGGYYQVTVTSSDPCAIYTPTSVSDALNSGGGGSNISDALLNALGGSGGQTVTPSGGTNVLDIINNAAQSTSTQQTTTTTPTTPTTSTQLSPTGSISISSTGATIISNVKQGITEVAGFFGGNTFGGSSGTSVAGRMCASRPWAGNGFLAGLMPDNFLDSICSRAGYQVGVVAQQQTTGGGLVIPKSQQAQQPTGQTNQAPLPSLGTVSVDIWAEPATVRLGTRAYIFWNARGVTTCDATGPSFSQKSLSGGASTIPISGPTTFSIECTAPDGTKATDSVTVQLSI